MEVGGVQWPAVRDTLEAVAAASSAHEAEAAGRDEAVRAGTPSHELASPGVTSQGDVALPGTAAAPLLAREGLAERLLGSLPTPADPSNAPAQHVEHGAETATAQAFGRPDQQVQQAQQEAHQRPTDTSLAVAQNLHGEFALPADQLVHTTLIGLQVQPSWLPHLPFAVRQERGESPAPTRQEVDEIETEPAPEVEPVGSEAQESHEESPPDEVMEPDDDVEGCDAFGRAMLALLQALPAAGSAAHPLGVGAQAALAAIRDQWQRGRAVVIACPQGADPAGPAWAYVMRPRRVFTRELENGLRFASLAGRRVPARLQWRQVPRGAQWLHHRMAKEHQPPRGRQLVPLAGPAALCDVQLGPVLAERRRACEVRLRIDAVRRFWGALGDQWSLLVVVCSLPLAGRAEAADGSQETTEVRHDC